MPERWTSAPILTAWATTSTVDLWLTAVPSTENPPKMVVRSRSVPSARGNDVPRWLSRKQLLAIIEKTAAKDPKIASPLPNKSNERLRMFCCGEIVHRRIAGPIRRARRNRDTSQCRLPQSQKKRIWNAETIPLATPVFRLTGSRNPFPKNTRGILKSSKERQPQPNKRLRESSAVAGGFCFDLCCCSSAERFTVSSKTKEFLSYMKGS